MVSTSPHPPDERESSPGEPAGSGAEAKDSGAESSGLPFADLAVEMAGLARRWFVLTLQQGAYALRVNVSEALILIGMCAVGGVLLVGGIVFLDLLLYRWLQRAFESGEWALAALCLGHVAVGGILIRGAMMKLRGEEES